MSAPATKQAAAFESNFSRGGLESTVSVTPQDIAGSVGNVDIPSISSAADEVTRQYQQMQQQFEAQRQQQPPQQQQQQQPTPVQQQQQQTSAQQQQAPVQQQSSSQPQGGQGRDGLRTAAVSRFRNSFMSAGTAGGSALRK